MKLLTFTVPCYNSQDYMRRCVDSLLIGGEDVEIIIVDDGSSDDTGAQQLCPINNRMHQNIFSDFKIPCLFPAEQLSLRKNIMVTGRRLVLCPFFFIYKITDHGGCL